MPGILSDRRGRAGVWASFAAEIAAWLPLAVGLGACAGSAQHPLDPGRVTVFAGRGNVASTSERSAFRPTTASPEPAPADEELGFCGAFDAALERVAERLVAKAARGEADVDSEELDFELRAEGEPHTWPEAWVLAPRAGSEDTSERARAWLATLAPTGERRCGAARSTAPDGARLVALVVVGALADLEPVPTRARLGQWVVFRATMLAAANGANVVVLPPHGAPRTLLTTLHGPVVEATFSVDQQGPWLVQLVGSVSGGPRPLLEARIFVDEEAPREAGARTAPGENAAKGARNDAEALVDMVNAVRGAEGVKPFIRSPELDRVALEHAERMRVERRLAHDAGDGNPADRLRAAGIESAHLGENVAHAKTVQRAHRVLWESPSHRENLLDGRFDKLGVGVSRDEDGSLWVTELFWDSDDAGILRRRSETY